METTVRPSRRPGKRAYLLITAFAFLLVLFPFLFWYGTWFGRRLTSAQIDEYVNPGTLVGHIGETEVRAPLPGEVRALDKSDGSAVKAGDPLVELSPDEKHVWEALRALCNMGEPGDLNDVKRYMRGAPGMTD